MKVVLMLLCAALKDVDALRSGRQVKLMGMDVNSNSDSSEY